MKNSLWPSSPKEHLQEIEKYFSNFEMCCHGRPNSKPYVNWVLLKARVKYLLGFRGLGEEFCFGKNCLEIIVVMNSQIIKDNLYRRV